MRRERKPRKKESPIVPGAYEIGAKRERERAMNGEYYQTADLDAAQEKDKERRERVRIGKRVRE
jgi:hypothetical protein